MRGRAITYSAVEMAWLEANRSMVISDYHRAFQAAFKRPDVSLLNLHSLRKRKGWFVGRGEGRFAGRHRKYSPAELAWLRENSALDRTACHAAFQARFQRPEVSIANLTGLRKRLGLSTGRTGRFEKGQAPLNKGKVCPEGVGGRHPNARRTQFKKGQVSHTYRGPGHERIDAKDGYVILIVEETNPWTGAKTRPVHKHRWLWEKLHGLVPEGQVLKCLDGNKTNTDPSNWTLVARGLLPRLNGGRHKNRVGFDQAPAELKPVLMNLAKVEQAVHDRRRKGRP